MKILLIALILAAGTALSQGLYIPTSGIAADTAGATTTWDSVAIPFSTLSTMQHYVTVVNEGSGAIYVALENDTTYAKRVLLNAGECLYYDHGVKNRKWLRTRSLSGTVLRHVFIFY